MTVRISLNFYLVFSQNTGEGQRIYYTLSKKARKQHPNKAGMPTFASVNLKSDMTGGNAPPPSKMLITKNGAFARNVLGAGMPEALLFLWPVIYLTRYLTSKCRECSRCVLRIPYECWDALRPLVRKITVGNRPSFTFSRCGAHRKSPGGTG